VIGGSAGALEALREIIANLPADLPAAIFIVIHTSAAGPGMLAEILKRDSDLTTATAADGDRIVPGTILVAPPNRHMRLERDRVRICGGPTINRHRPAIDMLFRSAATAHGPRVIGVLLSGYLDDGALGLLGIRRAGGVTICQDPEDALVGNMPQAAIDAAAAEHVLPHSAIAELLVRLTGQPVEAEKVAMNRKEDEKRLDARASGTPSVFTCPDCNGTLWEVEDGNISRYTCRVGHAYSQEALDDAQAESVERSLWAGLRALEERVALADRMAARAVERGHDLSAETYQRTAAELREQAGVLRQMLVAGNGESRRERVA
jgi:two-component system, chemotaxis family, protein-glutamate methylesterase/glutaminase